MLRDSVEQLVNDLIGKPVLTDAERDDFRRRYRELRDRVLAAEPQVAADSPTASYLATAKKLIDRAAPKLEVKAEPVEAQDTPPPEDG